MSSTRAGEGFLDAALQGTVLKLAEANTRVREESANTLMFLAGLPGELGCFYVSMFLDCQVRCPCAQGDKSSGRRPMAAWLLTLAPMLSRI